MRTREVRIQYHKAIEYIRDGRYDEALALLLDVNRERPNVKNVLYPMAYCCEKLGYVEEGISLCDQLIMQYDHAKAHTIKEHLMRLRNNVPVEESTERESNKAAMDTREELSPRVATEEPLEVPAAEVVEVGGSPVSGKRGGLKLLLVLVVLAVMAGLGYFVLQTLGYF